MISARRTISLSSNFTPIRTEVSNRNDLWLNVVYANVDAKKMYMQRVNDVVSVSDIVRLEIRSQFNSYAALPPGSDKAEAEKVFMKIAAAYELLSGSCLRLYFSSCCASLC